MVIDVLHAARCTAQTRRSGKGKGRPALRNRRLKNPRLRQNDHLDQLQSMMQGHRRPALPAELRLETTGIETSGAMRELCAGSKNSANDNLHQQLCKRPLWILTGLRCRKARPGQLQLKLHKQHSRRLQMSPAGHEHVLPMFLTLVSAPRSPRSPRPSIFL